MSYTDINDTDARRLFMAPAGVMTTLCRDNGLGWLTPRLLFGRAHGRLCRRKVVSHTGSCPLLEEKHATATKCTESALRSSPAVGPERVRVLLCPARPWSR